MANFLYLPQAQQYQVLKLYRQHGDFPKFVQAPEEQRQDWRQKKLNDAVVCEKVIVTFSTEKEKEEILKAKIPKDVKLEIFGEENCF